MTVSEGWWSDTMGLAGATGPAAWSMGTPNEDWESEGQQDRESVCWHRDHTNAMLHWQLCSGVVRVVEEGKAAHGDLVTRYTGDTASPTGGSGRPSGSSHVSRTLQSHAIGVSC